MLRQQIWRWLGRLVEGTSRLIFVALLLLTDAGRSTIPPDQVFDLQLAPIVRDAAFDLIRWQVDAITDKVVSTILGQATTEDTDQTLARYFRAIEEAEKLDTRLKHLYAEGTDRNSQPVLSLERDLAEARAQKATLEDQVEKIIAGRVESALRQEGLIYDWPLGSQVVFPPVQFELTEPPLVLVISPRDKIETKTQVHLSPALTLRQMEAIESQTDKLGVSSLVVPIGGLATWPTMLLETTSLDWTVETTAHEWIHNYLFFQPLGQHYSDSGDLTTINETVADLAAAEIAAVILGKPRPNYAEEVEEKEPAGEETTPKAFDFNKEMRKTRLRVDELLAAGQVGEAEAYMEERRQFIVAHGHDLRKLNQAYFAFYGSYADAPASVSPIGPQLKRLRAHNPSLKAFLDRVSRMTHYDDLRKALAEIEVASPRPEN